MKNQSVRVFIATTHGLVEVLSITELPDPELQSVISINHTSKLAGISKQYGDFVESPQGIIKRDFGGAAYRINLSNNIDQGESWQLPIYFAHYLHQRGLLNLNTENEQNTNPSDDTIIIASGRIDTLSGRVLLIDQLDKKCLCANNQIQQWQQHNTQVLFLVPSENLRSPVPDTSTSLTPVNSIDDLVLLTQTYLSSATLNASRSQDLKQDNDKLIEDAVFIDNKPSDQNNTIETHVSSQHGAADKNSFARRFAKSRVFVFILLIVVSCFYAFKSFVFVTEGASPSYFLLTASTSATGNCGSSNVSIIHLSEITEYSDLATNSFPKSRLRLCELAFISNHQMKDIILVSESKALIRLNRTSSQDLVPLLKSIQNKEISEILQNANTEASLNRWSIPIPSNQELPRSYHLMLFNEAFDDADLQSLESYLKSLYEQNKQHNDIDLAHWNRKANLQRSVHIIHHQLSF